MGPLAQWSTAPTAAGRALLSSRERQIADCVALGYTNRGIAGALEITEKTVEKHLTKIFHKLGLHSRAQLLLFIVSEESAPERIPLSARRGRAR